MFKPVTKSIPFNIPFDGRTAFNAIMADSFDTGKLFCGSYAANVRAHFKKHYGAKKVVLTSACTRALELTALLLELKPGDEVIAPSYTYVSSANAFELHGAQVKFCDSSLDSPNMDIGQLEAMITPKTRAIVVVHYAGISVDMDALVELARKHALLLVEDAAQGVQAFYKDRPLGSFGDFAVLSFHETKNVTCGQGGALLINNPAYIERATVLKNVGTNRHRFVLGLEDKYTWIDSGSVFNLSELCCAYLHPQLEAVEAITQKRVELWEYYYEKLSPLAEKGFFALPKREAYARHNGHIFYFTLKNNRERDDLMFYLKDHGIIATFHYVALHQSPYYVNKYGKQPALPNAERFSECLLRLPMYHALSMEDQDHVIQCIFDYFEQKDRHPEPVPQVGQAIAV